MGRTGLSRWIIVLLCGAPLAGLGVYGELYGSIRDPSSAFVPGVKLVLRSELNGFERTFESGPDGSFAAPLLPLGTYQLTAEKSGFQPRVVTGILLSADGRLQVDVRLELSAVNAQLEVSAESLLLQTGGSALDQLIDREKVINLPINQRNFMAFVLLTPGATTPAYGSFNGSQGGAFNVNGGREQANNFLLDGVDNNDPRLYQYAVLPSLEAIEEFQVQSANMSSAFGYPGGAQVNMVLRSGSNRVHGSLFEFLRNRHLDARGFFDPPACGPETGAAACGDKPRLDRNQFGGSAGGPLKRDRAFIFAAYEQLILNQGLTRRAIVPSLSQLDATYLAVPASERNPAGDAVLRIYPAANVGEDLRTSNVFTSTGSIRDRYYQGLIKTDVQGARLGRLTGHYAVSDQNRFNPFDPAASITNLPGFGTFVPKRGDNIGASWTREFRRNLMQEVRVGFGRARTAVQHQSSGEDKSSELKFPRTAQYPEALGFPTVNITGFDSIGEAASTPDFAEANTLHFAANTFVLTGGSRQTIRFGGDFRRLRPKRTLSPQARGSWSFLGGFTGASLTDVLRGIPTSALVGQGDSLTDVKEIIVDGYLQDDLRVTPTFTLNLGIRYEYASPPERSPLPFFRPDLSAASATCSPRPSCQFMAAEAFAPDRNNLAPRIGFAWKPSANHPLVSRAAYGIFYVTSSMGPFNTYSLNPPLFQLRSYPNNGEYTIQTILTQPATNVAALSLNIDPTLRSGYIQQWNANIQYSHSANTLFDAAYVGSKGSKLLGPRDMNQPLPGGSRPRPYPQFGPILALESRAVSNYHALQLRAERRAGSNLTYLASYTWARSIDDASSFYGLADPEAYGPQDSRNLRGERALSTFHASHRFVLSAMARLPLGIRASGIFTLQSGHPVSVFRSVDQSGTAPHVLGDLSDRPDLIADPMQPGPVPGNPDPRCHTTSSQGGRASEQVRDPASWFNPCAFAAPATRGFGSAGRNVVIGPGIANLDFSLSKAFRVGEGRTLELRGEAFNLLNHPQFDMPNIFFDSAGFTTVQSVNSYGISPPRQIQLGVRFSF